MTSSTTAAATSDTSRALLLSLVLIALLLGLQAWRYRPPPSVPADAPIEAFSAMRAIDALRLVLGDESPHPTGSAANRLVRDRIVASLTALGYAPELQTGRACDEWGNCAAVDNIVARLDGSEPGPAVALTVHYDSVGAGPGAGDDGIGVATMLEIARQLKAALPKLRHPLLLLITDGEETGLLGARLFVDQHRWAPEVRAAVNLEARGNQGPSFMFETGRRNAWAMSLYRSAVARPISNSIYYSAYQLLPNDTDFTVFKAAGWEGYNFALTGNVQHYHTPLDNLAHLSLASLQHHGDNALATLLSLADAPLPAAAPDEPVETAVYVDLLAAAVLVWPSAWAMPMALGSALIGLLLVLVQLRHRRLRPASMLRTTAAFLLALLLAGLACAVLLLALRSIAAIPPTTAVYRWTAQPLPLSIATAALSAISLLVVARVLRPSTCLAACWSASVLLLALATLASAALLPGLSFAFQLPLLALLLAALWPSLISDAAVELAPAAALSLAALLGVLVLVPTIGFLHQSLGPDSLIATAALLVWVHLPLLGLLALARPRLLKGLTAVAAATLLAAVVASAWSAPYSETSPQRLNLEYQFDTDRNAAEWLVRPDSGVLPPSLAAVAAFTPRAEPVFPWSRGQTWRADAANVLMPPPELRVLAATAEGEGWRYETWLRSPRGARSISLCWPPDARPGSILLDGHRLPKPDARTRATIDSRRAGWTCVADQTLPDDGVGLAFTMPDTGPVEVLLFDRSAGLPSSGLALQQARPASATAAQDGDVSRVIRRVRIAPP